MTPKKLHELVQNMHDKVENGLAFNGCAMFDDKGKQLGIWYSLLEAKTSLEMKDDRTVIIITPDINTY